MARRRWIILIALLPAAFAIVWLLYAQIRFRQTPAPRWTVSAGEVGISLQTCAGAQTLAAYNAHPADETGATGISRSKARAIADRVIARHHSPANTGGVIYGGGPYLATLTLPDGQAALAWARVVTDGGGATLLGKGDIVFIDAESGDPLLLITDVPVGDPGMTCGTDFAFLFRQVSELYLPLGFGLIYLVTVGLVMGLRALLRRRRRIAHE